MHISHHVEQRDLEVESSPKPKKKDVLSQDIVRRIYRFLRYGLSIAMLLSLNGSDKGTTAIAAEVKKMPDVTEHNQVAVAEEQYYLPKEVRVQSYNEFYVGGKVQRTLVDENFDCFVWNESDIHTLSGLIRYYRNPDGTIMLDGKGNPLGHTVMIDCRQGFEGQLIHTGELDDTVGPETNKGQ